MKSCRYIGAAAAIAAAMMVLPGCGKLDWNLGDWWGGAKPATATQPAASAPAATAPASAPATHPWRTLARQYANGTALGAEHGANFIAFDTLAYPRAPVDLAVKLVSPRGLKPIVGVTVAITRDSWVAGRVTTDAHGIASLRWTPPEVGNYTFTARVVAVPSEAQAELLAIGPAELLVAAREKDTRFFVVDLDHTVVDSEFVRVLLDGGKPMAGSVPVTNRLAGQYGIIYLTHRPDLLTRRSKAFLRDNGYPPGPLLVSELKDVLRSEHFKATKLSELRKAFPGVVAGVGDVLTDVQAYSANGMSAYLIPRCKDKPRDLRKLAAELRALHESDRLQVVASWRELEQAVFQGRPFTPQSFADRLEQRAKQFEADPKARGKTDQDD